MRYKKMASIMALLILTANMPSQMVFAEEQLVGSISSGAKAANVPASEVDYESIYSGAIENVKSEVEQEGADYGWLQYAFYDMDQDGYLELLIQNGTCVADMTYEVYTTDGTECYYAGNAGGMAQSIYAAPEDNGFYTYFWRQNLLRMCEITLKDKKISSRQCFDVEDRDYRTDYEEMKLQIKTRTLDEEPEWEASEVVDADAEGQYIFPNSDTEYLSYEEVSAKSDEELLWGRNEIYARHGYIFQDESIRQHFENTDWYQGTVSSDQFDTSVFNDYELANIDLIVQVESERENGGSSDNGAVLQKVVDYTGEYEDGNGDYLVMSQNLGKVSYDWYYNGEYLYGETDISANLDWSITGNNWSFYFDDAGNLIADSGTEEITFWRGN